MDQDLGLKSDFKKEIKEHWEKNKKKILNRVFAKIVDFLIVILMGAVLPRVIGPLLGCAYSLLADGMPFEGWKGQSAGKKIFRLQVLHRVRKEPIQLRDSFVRNLPIGIGTFFGIIPIWGWIILILVGFPILLIELYLVIRLEQGQRLGDVMADTEVVEIPDSSPKLLS